MTGRRSRSRAVRGFIEKLDGIRYVKSPMYDWYVLWSVEAREFIRTVNEKDLQLHRMRCDLFCARLHPDYAALAHLHIPELEEKVKVLKWAVSEAEANIPAVKEKAKRMDREALKHIRIIDVEPLED